LRGILETPLEPLEEAMLQYKATDSWDNLKPSNKAAIDIDLSFLAG